MLWDLTKSSLINSSEYQVKYFKIESLFEVGVRGWPREKLCKFLKFTFFEKISHSNL